LINVDCCSAPNDQFWRFKNLSDSLPFKLFELIDGTSVDDRVSNRLGFWGKFFIDEWLTLLDNLFILVDHGLLFRCVLFGHRPVKLKACFWLPGVDARQLNDNILLFFS
jgi:hypothetical protein